jgi:uncharacterized protein with HEPN domain
MNPDDRVCLTHMVDALNKAIGFTKGRSRADLDTDAMLAFALMQAVQIVGEAANNISQETRAQCPQIPWPVIIGMRHRLVHAYTDVDHDILWTTVIEAAPPLLAQVTSILGED